MGGKSKLVPIPFIAQVQTTQFLEPVLQSSVGRRTEETGLKRTKGVNEHPVAGRYFLVITDDYD